MNANSVLKNADPVPEAAQASRRQFLRLAALSLGAGAAGLAGCSTPTPEIKEVIKTVEVTRPVEVIKTVEVTKEVVRPAPKVPWQYVSLDVELARKNGHLGFYEGECCYGAFSAIMKQLVDRVGFPFDQFPVEAMKFGAGGVAGWGTLCGALLGSATAISLVVEAEDAKKIIGELLGWYTQTPFPSDLSNEYATNKQFLVEEYKSDQVLAQSISASPLCHVSVSKWCQTSGYASGSKERGERCGRLAGDVAAHAVELLNAHFAGSFASSYKPSAEAQMCMTCHTKGENFEIGNFTQGNGECLECHEPHELK